MDVKIHKNKHACQDWDNGHVGGGEVSGWLQIPNQVQSSV